MEIKHDKQLNEIRNRCEEDISQIKKHIGLEVESQSQSSESRHQGLDTTPKSTPKKLVKPSSLTFYFPKDKNSKK